MSINISAAGPSRAQPAMESRGIEGMPMAGLRMNWLESWDANKTCLVLSDVEMVSIPSGNLT